MHRHRCGWLGWMLGCCLGGMAGVAGGQNCVTIQAFQSNGRLTFSAPTGTLCAVEWASHPTSEWSSSWRSLESLPITAPTTTVNVPMFYRVVCWSNPTALLVLPVDGISHLGPINEAYSQTASCPWGFEHNGLDFAPTLDLVDFVATASGLVDKVELHQNGDNWAVNVRILHADDFASEYDFEPMSSAPQDGSNQLDNIVVTEGQTVGQGMYIGSLCTPSNGAHVHYQFMTNWNAICPEPYFDHSAVTSILYLLHLQWPGADMCY